MNNDIINNYLTGELDEAGIKELFNWVNANDVNKNEFIRQKNAWVAAGVGKENSLTDLEKEFALFTYRISETPLKEESRKITPARYHNFGSILMRIAAVIVLLYSLGLTYFHFKREVKTTYNEIFTLGGQRTSLVLSDGTKIWLNSESHLKYPDDMDGRNVKVYLEGEAYFNVSKKHGRKFIVNTSDIDISVLGTSFNVKSYPGDEKIETTLEEGKISITGKIGENKLKQPIVLIPNQRVIFSKSPVKGKECVMIEATESQSELAKNKELQTHQPKIPNILIQEYSDTKFYTSWKDGKLEFRGEPFEDLAIRLERWYDVSIEIDDDEIKAWEYTGTFDKETIEQALRALSLSMPFTYTIKKNLIKIER